MGFPCPASSPSPREHGSNQYVAELLNRAGLATLLFDLLTSAEAQDRANVFAIDLLAERLASTTMWLTSQPEAAELAVGYFGASTGAAAALVAAAGQGSSISAVVSRGGRPDLAAPALPDVAAPTLLIVGSLDTAVLPLNQQAYDLLGCERRLEVVAGATHLFEEPGTLDEVARLTADWFIAHVPGSSS
jgi:putative phosphoribosyl transferase